MILLIKLTIAAALFFAIPLSLFETIIERIARAFTRH